MRRTVRRGWWAMTPAARRSLTAGLLALLFTAGAVVATIVDPHEPTITLDSTMEVAP